MYVGESLLKCTIFNLACRKRPRVDEPKDSDDHLASTVKRGRGRPKKSDATSTQSVAPAQAESTGSTENAEVPAKRGRGRPKKEFEAKVRNLEYGYGIAILTGTSRTSA
jgi:hypothetical protein